MAGLVALEELYSNSTNNIYFFFLFIFSVAFFSRLLAMGISYRFFPSVTTISAVFGGMLPRLSANIVISFTSRVGSRATLKWTALALSMRLNAINLSL